MDNSSTRGMARPRRSPTPRSSSRRAPSSCIPATSRRCARSWSRVAPSRWRSNADPTTLTGPIRAMVAAMDPSLAIANVQPMQALVDRAMAPTRFALVLIGIFAAIAAILAAVGLYGVLSTLVRLRTAEIGLRMAFGAQPRSIMQLIVGQGLRLSAVGILIGGVSAL